MRTPGDLRTLYQLGISWERAATALARSNGRALGAASPEARVAFGAAADSCRILREAILSNPDGPLPRCFMSALRTRTAPHHLADLLEQVAATLSNLQDGSLQAVLTPRPALARLAEFLSDTGQEILRTVARRRQLVAS
ncbi:MAG: hypothetical protein FJZ01_02310 [Candidatus Sericytochromatia bacterium]|nr:hypothetical protein [Candidatus Tanganyikabacteria bacterium]